MLKTLCVTILVFAVSCASLLERPETKEKAQILLQLAADRFTAGDYNKSLESVQDSLKLDPEYPAAYNQMGLVFLETKRLARAEEAFQAALKLQPDYPEVFNNLGVLYTRMEKYPAAIAQFEKALTYESYFTPENAYTNLGNAHYKMGNSTRAKYFHQKALDISPQFCLASKNMGDIYAKEKNFQKASDYFKRATSNCPLFQEAQYKLGLALMKLGQKQVAKVQFEKLVGKHKEGPYVERSQEVLKLLQ